MKEREKKNQRNKIGKERENKTEERKENKREGYFEDTLILKYFFLLFLNTQN